MVALAKDQRVRTRLANDCRTNARLLESELQNYRGDFWSSEIRTIQEIMLKMRALADRIDANDAISRQA